MAREVRFRIHWGVVAGGVWEAHPPPLPHEEEMVRLSVERRAPSEHRLLDRRQDRTRCLSCRRKVTRRRGARRH